MNKDRSVSGTGWIACLAAMPFEMAGLRRLVHIDQTLHPPGVTIYQCHSQGKKALLVETGIGRAKAEHAVDYVLSQYQPGALISFGFAGGLSTHLKIGDLVLCQHLFQEHGNGPNSVICADPGLLAAAQNLEVEGIAALLGSSISVDKVISLQEEKRALAERYQADIVEMESYWIGRACVDHQVPFLAIRAISDTAAQNLPPLERLSGLVEEKRWQMVLLYLMTHPGQLASLARFFRSSQQAQRRLTHLMYTFLVKFHAFVG